MNSGDVTVDCSWTIENVNDVWKKILWKEQQGELTEETNPENCFMICQSSSASESKPCTLKFTLKTNRKFQSVYILSEVPMMEVYGQCEEYLSTIKGDLLDEVEGSSLYEVKIDLKKLQSEILLKFCKIKDKSQIWVYGISVVTKTTAAPPKPFSHPAGFAATGGNINSLLSSFTPGTNANSLGGPKPFEGIEAIVDKKVKEMEERIINRIQERFDLLEEKMNQNNEKLIELLTEIKSK